MRIATAMIILMALAADAPPEKPDKSPPPALTQAADIEKTTAEKAIAEEHRRAAAEKLKEAEAAAKKALVDTPQYQVLTATQKEAETELQEARRAGTPQEKLDASGEFNRARAAAEKFAIDFIVKYKPLADAQDSLAAATAEVENAGKELGRAIARTDEELPHVRAHFSLDTLEVGNGGKLADIKVMQIIGPADMIAEIGVRYYEKRVENGVTVTYLGGVLKTAWIHGIDTTKLADGERIWGSKTYKIVGTKKYDNAGGSTTTVFLFELIEEN